MTHEANVVPGRLAVLLHDLRGGGAERVTIKLIQGLLDQGRQVDVVLVQASGEYLDLVPAGARVVDLNKKHVFAAIPALASYLRRETPVALLASLTHVNILAILAHKLSGLRTRVVVSERNQISVKAATARALRARLTYRAAPIVYRFADAVTAVSEGVARDVDAFCRFKPGTVKAIYNPVYSEAMAVAAAQPVALPWLDGAGEPVIVAVGRLHSQKGFDVLIEALALVRSVRPARLIILGEGDERAALEARVLALGLEQHVMLPGFISNPYAAMARSSVFVLSSRFEGLPGALIEAMACGAPVVATDCPSGPHEVLDGGRFGPLVPTDDPHALAAAIVEALDNGPRPGAQERARSFSIESSTRRYLEVLES